MDNTELSFDCSIQKSKFGDLWIGRCESLRIHTQGDDEADTLMALSEAIWLRLTAPQRRKQRTSEYANRVNISLAQVMETAHAAGTSAS